MSIPPRRQLPPNAVPHEFHPSSLWYGLPGIVSYRLLAPGETAKSPFDTPPTGPEWVTVKQLAHEYGHIITESALRNLIWHAEAYQRNPKPGHRSNGFLDLISRPGNARKVLLNRWGFPKWIAAGRVRSTTT